MESIESEAYLKLAVKQLKEILEDIDDEWMTRGRIKQEVSMAINLINSSKNYEEDK